MATYYYHRRLSDKFFDFLIIGAVTVLALLCLYPFWYVIILSFNTGQNAMQGGVIIWPHQFTLMNLEMVLKDPRILNGFLISIARVAVVVPLSLLVNAGCAYAMTRPEFRIKGIVTTVFVATILFNGGLIPYYLVLVELKINNSFWVYVWPGLASVWTIIVMRVSFKEIHPALIESAMVDGANHGRIWWGIIMPLSKPMLAAMALFTSVGVWNEWFAGNFFVSNPALRPLSTVLFHIVNKVETRSLIQRYITNQNFIEADKLAQVTPLVIQMAAVFVTTLPILIVYPFLQKYFMKGVMVGSIKE